MVSSTLLAEIVEGRKSCESCEIFLETLIEKVADTKCCEKLFSKTLQALNVARIHFPKKLQAINVAMNSFEWKQNEHKILAFVVWLPKFPKNTLN